jgi:hypothetical protein
MTYNLLSDCNDSVGGSFEKLVWVVYGGVGLQSHGEFFPITGCTLPTIVFVQYALVFKRFDCYKLRRSSAGLSAVFDSWM